MAGEVVAPVMKLRSGFRPVGDDASVSESMCGAHGNAFQAYGDLCAKRDNVVNVPECHIEATTFNWGSSSEKMFADPLKLNHSHPATSLKKNREIKQNAYVMENVCLQESKNICLDEYVNQNTYVMENVCLEESKNVCLDEYVNQVRRAEQSDLHSFFVEPPLVSLRADSVLLEETYTKDLLGQIGTHSPSCLGTYESCDLKLIEVPSARNANEDHEDVVITKLKIGRDIPEGNDKDLNSTSNIIEKAAAYIEDDLRKESMNDSQIRLVEKAVTENSRCIISTYEKRGAHNPKRTSPTKTTQHQQDASTPKDKYLSRLLRQANDAVPKGESSTGPNMVPLKRNNISIQEKHVNSRLNSSKGHLDVKTLPNVDLYTIEKEEGSGGYGTVYRARRKSDGIKFAIKYPHPNANKQHVDNERKMLERFGGKNYVIKYEGSCRSGNSECIVLEHVEHDRPDALKKEIDISELQWYGYCMFSALASLHKLGVVHRDVKPGNFLFSRKTCIGYMIDFNLAKDLHQKQANTGNSVNLHPKAVKHVSPSKRRKILGAKSPELAPGGPSKELKSMDSKMLRKKALSASHRNYIASQGPNGSGLTSAKDLTNTRTRSAERLREPLPCQGRKELINLAQEAMRNTMQEVGGASAYKRKRIAATPAIIDRKLVHYTPMPIHSSGIAINASAFLEERGEGKVQKEGPCAGTKGFRAPEALLRSPHQGPKLDVWSAGVTLLYLMIGKPAFTGEPEQNMKDIVKLRGSEELWELAKLHNRESLFPTELYDAQFLQALTLEEWCKAKTKRPNFLKVIPGSLFDLVNKCLTVNPRLRISAEEALEHEFFAPCLDTVRKRLLSGSTSMVSDFEAFLNGG